MGLRDLRWRDDLGPTFMVWVSWLVLSVAAFHYVHKFSVDIPWCDEWELVPAITGHQAVTPKWLWSQHNEHRIAIPRLIYLATFKMTGGDFRAGAYFNAAMLVVSAAAMLIVIRKVRGSTRTSDLLFPILSLNWGQWENISYSMHIQWISACILAIVALLLMVRRGPLSVKSAAVVGVMAILLPLCGGNGVALSPALAMALFLAGWAHRRRSVHGWKATLGIWALGAAALAVTAFYFVDYARPAKHPPSHDGRAIAEGAVEYLLTGFGVATRTTWPNVKFLFDLLVFVLAAALVVVWIVRPEERPRIFRLVCFMGAIISLALGTSWARRGLASDYTFSSRYATPAAAFWFASYFAWETVDYLPLRRLAQTGLCLVAACFLIANRNEGIAYGRTNRDARLAFQRDLHAGGKLEEVAAKHWNVVYYDLPLSVNKDTPAGLDTFKKDLKMLKDSGIGEFGNLKD